MGVTKTDYFTDRQNELATMLKAMGHPARIAIIDYLLKVNACICNDIVSELPLAQPTISQHLKELKNAGIIKGNVEGKAICYCIDERVIGQLQQYFGGMFETITSQKSTCC
ncbi:transcriptional regulator, ArsR family [Emticicia oligotrophica DSM 17448]|uniref:Transcriptional regulator, ArsR family n=1 Tax=Emticicia oligotrophica (strain DSM 17448 / CIP 109782 / MTCC 6937 / GPTSA100-15) TaxID=929562 RepID=A0ABM5MZG1_EMTOG|nr:MULTISPECIES: metalloregulator ArsR/SmtB family transcription factor [Emticicia]AFK02497.1 transcriptional regulator, ArsR family [Emticicia oligotrophica DSM 17448]